MMSASNVIGNRNSTPEASSGSSLRPPSSRALGSGGHHLRASADMASYTSSPQSSRIRPSSEVYYGQNQQAGNHNNAEHEAAEKAAQQWIADIDQSETTLEEMAEATLDQDFKDELSAIEQWFKVLSEAERTAALYALLQQTTQIQIRFFIQVLQQMGKSHPMSGVLSPASFDKDPMANRLSDAMNKHNIEGSRNSLVRPPPSPGAAGAKRNSQLDPSTINAMFPDAAAAIATQKAAYTQKTGNLPASNRNSAIYENRMSLNAPIISGPVDAAREGLNQPASPWGVRPTEQQAQQQQQQQQQPIAKPKPPMDQHQQQSGIGKFTQPPPSAGLRPTRPQQISGSSNLQSTTVNAPDRAGADISVLSPYNPGINWASNLNTPMVSNFGQTNPVSQADMVANATAMKLAALSTVNNRIALDDVRKYRRGRSNDNIQGPMSPALVPNVPGTSVVMVNENGQVLNAEQVAAMQARSNAGNAFGQMGAFGAPQNNGFLSAYDGSSSVLSNGMSNLNLGYGLAAGGSHEGYVSDHSDIARGRSPRGRRGSSKPPEDPTDPNLLQDIPSWLRSLRLHKYTDNLKDMKWTDLVELDDAGLEAKGVAAVGARRKMLKVFEQVKEARADGKL